MDLPIEIPDHRPDYWIEGIQEAALAVAARWNDFTEASDPVTQGGALVELNNAMFDLSTYLPGYDVDQGGIDWSLFE